MMLRELPILATVTKKLKGEAETTSTVKYSPCSIFTSTKDPALDGMRLKSTGLRSHKSNARTGTYSVAETIRAEPSNEAFANSTCRGNRQARRTPAFPEIETFCLCASNSKTYASAALARGSTPKAANAAIICINMGSAAFLSAQTHPGLAPWLVQSGWQKGWQKLFTIVQCAASFLSYLMHSEVYRMSWFGAGSGTNRIDRMMASTSGNACSDRLKIGLPRVSMISRGS